ncbi:MAG: 3-deoxy-7-phosphoheptulonate synthase [Bacteroidetes bacterium]|nr:3-deoxy-7-phosphoheptulonate synthase [Bacteroidota bacterium]
MEINTSYRLVKKTLEKPETLVNVSGNIIGGDEFTLIAGPCAIESEEQIFSIAEFLSNKGIKIMRGGAYKPRTSPYAFQGLKKEGLKLLKKVSEKYGMKVITEVLDLSLLDTVYPFADILQIGARNMKNYHFLKELGKTDKPILLKRGMDATIDEWLLAAEYILLGGNEKVILCERGIRSFDNSTRNIMDIAAIPLVKQLSHLPIIADPSQATGKRDLVIPLSLAAAAAGCDGIMVEVHNNPEKALSDGPQSLNFEQFSELVEKLKMQLAVSNKKFLPKKIKSELIQQ